MIQGVLLNYRHFWMLLQRIVCRGCNSLHLLQETLVLLVENAPFCYNSSVFAPIV